MEKFRNVLVHHKIGRGDKVALISNNRVEWAVAFYAVASVGGSIVPMYEAQVHDTGVGGMRRTRMVARLQHRVIATGV